MNPKLVQIEMIGAPIGIVILIGLANDGTLWKRERLGGKWKPWEAFKGPFGSDE